MYGKSKVTTETPCADSPRATRSIQGCVSPAPAPWARTRSGAPGRRRVVFHAPILTMPRSWSARRVACQIDIHECRLVDVKEASALLRLLGDPVRLRLLRVLSREALNVSELTAVLGLAQSGVSRHLGLLRTGRPRRRGTPRVVHRVPPRARCRGVRRARARRSGPGSRRSSRAPGPTRVRTTRGSRKCGGCGRRASSSTAAAARASARAGPKLGGLVARARPAAAGGRRRRSRVRRRVSDDRSGALGASRHRRRSVRRRSWRAPRRWPIGARSRTSSGSAATLERAAAEGPIGRRRAVVAGAAPCGSARGRARRGVSDAASRRPRAHPRPSGARRSLGPREARRQVARLQRGPPAAAPDRAPASRT